MDDFAIGEATGYLFYPLLKRTDELKQLGSEEIEDDNAIDNTVDRTVEWKEQKSEDKFDSINYEKYY